MVKPVPFNPVSLDKPVISSRQIISQLPAIHQTDTLQRFFGSSVNHLFTPGQGKQINGYIGQQPPWYNPKQDYYLTEPQGSRQFYQLESSMVSKDTNNNVTNLLFYPDIINQLRFQGAITDNHDRLFEQDFYSWCPPINIDMILNFRQYYWVEINDFKLDYLVIERGCSDRNPWSLHNYWYHKDDLTSNQLSTAVQANRPIIEFMKDLELFNYGSIRRRDIYDIVDNSNLISLVNDANNNHVSTIVINNITVNLSLSSIRVLVTNDNNFNLDNQIYLLEYSNGIINISIETDGNDSSGAPTIGEIIFVTKTNKELYFNGISWQLSQQKTDVNISPLFNLYDINNVVLNDLVVYPNSNFTGSKLFSYAIANNEIESGIIDNVLKFDLSFDSNGQINFQNYLATDRFSYTNETSQMEIIGFYFHKTTGDIPVYGNDWYKTNSPSRQMIVDQFVCDGINNLFTISQIPDIDSSDQLENLIVYRISQTNNAVSDYSYNKLIKNVDYVTFDSTIILVSSTVLDIIKVLSYSKTTPINSTGFYEVAPNLQSNPTNSQINIISSGDFHTQFSEILENQVGFIGQTYAANNWRSSTQDRSKGNTIVQHSADLLRLALTLSQSQLDFTSAIRYNESEYVRFKNKFEQKINQYNKQGAFSSTFVIADVVSSALKEISRGKTQTFPFANNNVALNNVTNFIPATPSYLGMYPIYVPAIKLDLTFKTEYNSNELTSLPQTNIQNHDGSLTPTYGKYLLDSSNNLILYTRNEDNQIVQLGIGNIDPRDSALLELENRIYNSITNNIKIRERPIFDWQKYYSAYTRIGDYTYAEYLSLLQPSFDRWINQRNLDFKLNSTFKDDDVLTWNWSQSTGLDGNLLPGHWRGIALYYFDTDRPHTHPWEMLGFTSEPIYWQSRYGVFPYTSNNFTMWNDLEIGLIAAGERAGIHPEWARKDLSKYIPVDENGNLLDPVQMGIAKDYPLLNFATADWKFGDCGPVESAWRRSSAFSFAATQAAYLMKPARFFGSFWDTENFDIINGQIIDTATKSRSNPTNLVVHGEKANTGSIIVRYGLQQWISEYIASLNQNVTQIFGNLVRGLGVQLAYKVAGFTDSANLFVSSDAFDRIPAEDVNVLLYQSPSIREEFYSAVAITHSNGVFKVYGYDIINPVFNTIIPNENGPVIPVSFGSIKKTTINNWKPNTYYSLGAVINHTGLYYECLRSHTASQIFENIFWQEILKPSLSSSINVSWYLNANNTNVVKVPYGTELNSIQEVANFLNSLERYYLTRGWTFDQVNSNGDVSNWFQSCYEFLAWFNDNSNTTGSFILLNPAAEQVVFETLQGEPQSVEQFINGTYSLIDRGSKPIKSNTVDIARSNGQLIITPTNTVNGGIYGCRLYITELEHIILFNNKTIFSNTIYDPLLNIRQPRLRLQGFKTTNWLGRINAPGFIITGKTLIPNFEKSADDFRHFFDIETIDDNTLQERARNNVGYYERDYLSNLLLTPTNQFEFYQGMIQHKGTPSVMSRLLRSNFIRNNSDIKFLEEWAFRVGDYGSLQVNPSFELQLKQSEVTTDPQLIRFSTQSSSVLPNVPNIIDIVDVIGNTPARDPRWIRRTDTKNINWITKQFKQGTPGFLPNTGYVDVNDISWTCLYFDDMINLYYSTLNNYPSNLITKTYNFSYDGISVNPANFKIAIIPNLTQGYLRINKIEFNITESFVENSMAISVGRQDTPMEFARASSEILNFGNDIIIRPSALFELNEIQDNTIYLDFEYGYIPPIGANIGKVSVTVTVEQFVKNVLPNHRVLVYNDNLSDWKTYKLHDTGSIISTAFVPSFIGQGTPVSFASLSAGLTNSSLILLDGVENSLKAGEAFVFDSVYNPVFSNTSRITLTDSIIAQAQLDTDGFAIIRLQQMISDAGMIIDSITFNTIVAFSGGAIAPQVKIGTQNKKNLYVKTYTPLLEFTENNPQVVNTPSFSSYLPVTVDIYDTTVSVAEDSSDLTVPVQIVRSGNIFQSLLSINVTNPGHNYISPPNVTVTGPQGVQAVANLAGPVLTILLTNGGSGYTSSPLVTIVGANGNGAVATATIANGLVSAINVINGGSAYTSPPTIIISGGGGAGTNATATINYGVSNVIITSTGGCLYDGSSTPTVSFSGGGGSGATATTTLSPPLPPMTVNWRYYRNLPELTGWTEGGSVTFTTINDVNNTGNHIHDYWLQTIQVPVISPETDTSIYQVEIYDPITNDSLYTIRENISTITVVKTQLDNNSVDLTVVGTTVISGGICESNDSLFAYLNTNGNTGTVIINITYHYINGFEVFGLDGSPKIISNSGFGGRLLSWIPTRFKNTTTLNNTIVPNNWNTRDIVEVDYNPNVLDNGGWIVYQYGANNTWIELRRENLKVDSGQFVNATIYQNDTNEVLQTLQIFDPYQGYIVGTADRELTYKTNYDPATYTNSSDPSIAVDLNNSWSSSQIGQLWWDLSKVRYIDYNISDDGYRWKNWGRLAPGISIDIYEWVRSPVPPSQWAGFTSNSSIFYAGFASTPNNGELGNNVYVGWVEQQEWIAVLNREVIVYYFWVKNVATLPLTGGRKLTALQVASIIENPSAQDIPWFAAIDNNQLIIGGIKQYLNDTNTILKLNWKIDTYEGNHHKQWKIVREDDDTSVIDLSLWNKMRDSLIGWDDYKIDETITTSLAQNFNANDISLTLTDASLVSPSGEIFVNNNYIGYTYKNNNILYGISNPSLTTCSIGDKISQIQQIEAPKTVPDPLLTPAEASGCLVRPRQTWFLPTIDDPNRANRYARQIFVETFNNLMKVRPYLDEWFQWQLIFEAIDPIPLVSEYNISAPSMFYRSQLASNDVVNPGQLVYVPPVLENNNFWTLWRYDPTNSLADSSGFVIQRAQKWRFAQNELWHAIDWYADNWSPADFPQIHYANKQAFLAAPTPNETTLLKGTLVAIDKQSDTDPRWSWQVYQNGMWTEVAKQNGTLELSSAFYDSTKVLYGLNDYIISNISNRDGSWELRFLLDKIPVTLFTRFQMSSLFFSMTRCALSINDNVDWAMKTSFMSIGGYTEPLKQAPLAYADQIDSIISYVEEVKPYHVKIRNYVIQYTVGPDNVNLHVTDFDNNTSEYRDVSSMASSVANAKTTAQLTAQAIAVAANISAIPNTSTPFLKVDNYNPTNWNGLRHFKTKVLFDRVACSGVSGWDTHPWDYNVSTYATNGNTGDILAPDYLNSLTHIHYNQNVKSLTYSGWDIELNPDTATRINLYYSPTSDMFQLDYPGLISGCDYRGAIQDGGPIAFGLWDVFTWDYQGGWANERAYYDGSPNSTSGIDTNIAGQPPGESTILTSDNRPGDLIILESDNSQITGYDGGNFEDPEISKGHPEELAMLKLHSKILITYKDDNSVLLNYSEY